MLWSASHHPKSALVGAQVFGKVNQPGCDLTWFLPWAKAGAPNWFVRGHQWHLDPPPHAHQKEQPLFVSQLQTQCEGQGEDAQGSWSMPVPFCLNSGVSGVVTHPLSSLLIALVPEQVLASRGLGTIFRKFPAANANEGHSLLLKNHLQVQICLPGSQRLLRRLNPLSHQDFSACSKRRVVRGPGKCVSRASWG